MTPSALLSGLHYWNYEIGIIIIITIIIVIILKKKQYLVSQKITQSAKKTSVSAIVQLTIFRHKRTPNEANNRISSEHD